MVTLMIGLILVLMLEQRLPWQQWLARRKHR
jgi:hypothetical protein